MAFHPFCCGLLVACSFSRSHRSTAQHRFPSGMELVQGQPVGWALGSTYGDVMGEALGGGHPALCYSHWFELGKDYAGCRRGASLLVLTLRRHSSVLPGHGQSLNRASLALEGSDKELVIGRKTSPFTHNYSSPLEPFHLLSVVTPVGLLSLPSHPMEL